MAVLELRAVRLEDVQPAVREAALRVLDVVAADGDVEPAVLVHVADAGLAVVGLLVLDAHLRRHIAERVPRAVAEVKTVAEFLVGRIGLAAHHLRVARDEQVEEPVAVEVGQAPAPGRARSSPATPSSRGA